VTYRTKKKYDKYISIYIMNKSMKTQSEPWVVW